MERRISTTVIVLVLLLVKIMGSFVVFAQNQADTYVIEEVISQNIYVEGCSGSIVLRVRTPKLDPDTKTEVHIEQVSIGDADGLSFRVIEEKNISSKGFTYYIYTIYISASQKEFSGTDLLCRSLILNISLVGQKYDSKLLYDSKLTIVTVCSLKTIIEGLIRNSSIVIDEIPRLRKDIKEINSSITAKGDDLSRVLENQSKLRLLTYVILASSSASLLLLVVLIILILRIRKEQPVIGL